HGQAIQWIERYGTVKGLGNLHPRLGYNSAFMCLLALFSVSCLGRSLHEVNGFICAFLGFYALASHSAFCRKERNTGADLMKISILFYIIYSIPRISSCGSDIFPMLTLLYLFAKWFELQQDTPEEEQAVPLGLLTLLSVLNITAKLSVAPVILTAVAPVIIFVRRKQVGMIIRFTCAAMLIGLPFLLRNVIISGYLIYPLEKLDLFSVDWKVPAERAAADRIDIELYAKGLGGLETRAYSFKEWIQIWFRGLEFVPRVLFFISVFLFVFLLFRVIYQIIRKKTDGRFYMAVTVMALYGYWFMMAPDMRFGIANLLLLPSFTIGAYLSSPESRVYLGFIALGALLLLNGTSGMLLKLPVNLVFPEDYRQFPCKEVYFETPSGREVAIYVPLEGDQSGVDVFPESPSADGNYEMLRGESLKEGFRHK
ncbi:MAG: hypothetical protein K6G83_08815, partial [Lachnospiraceae bacterium]|nr:hypothetical protein [Lachnospiraceae bacterium]